MTPGAEVPMIKKIIYVSKSVEPSFNLAFENWLIQDLFKTSNSPECLLIYRNRPSIIIGRNQNIWAECDTKLTHKHDIPILRRFSGGGTVYHDLGNVNYSLHRDKTLFNRTFAAEMIIKALKGHSSGSGLFLSPRHDIFYKIDQGESFKVSGSAYKLSRDRAYHHGTLLLSTDLSKISVLLKSSLNILKDENFKFGGVSSFPSPVTNIPNLSYETLLELVLKEFDPTEPLIEISESTHTNQAIEKYKQELESWHWTFSKSPPFKMVFNNNELIIESGLIKESSNDPKLINKSLNDLLQN